MSSQVRSNFECPTFPLVVASHMFHTKIFRPIAGHDFSKSMKLNTLLVNLDVGLSSRMVDLGGPRERHRERRRHDLARNGETGLPTRKRSLIGDPAKIQPGLDPERGAGDRKGRGEPHTANSGTRKGDRIVVFAHGEGVSKSCVTREQSSGKMTELIRLSPSESRHKKTLQAKAGRV
jgi:hypothetical protein